MSGPLVSVVIPVSRGQSVEQAIQSVIRSTYEHVEIVVVVKESTELPTEALLERLLTVDSITIVRHEDKGLPAALNTAIRLSKGEYIITLAEDGRIEPTFLMKSLWHLQRRPEFGIAYSHTERLCFTSLLYENIIPTTALFRRAMWDEIGGYDETLRDGDEDWEFWIRATASGWGALCITEAPVQKHRRDKHDLQVLYIRKKHRPMFGWRWKISLFCRDVRCTVWKAAQSGTAWLMRKSSDRVKGRLRKLYWAMRPLKDVPTVPYGGTGVLDICRVAIPDERIGLLIAAPWLKVGGVERVFLNIISQLDRTQYRVHLITTLRDEHPWSERFEPLVDRLLHLADFCHSEQEQVDFLCEYVKANGISCLHISHSQLLYRSASVIKEQVPHVVIFDTLHMEEPHEPWDYFRFAVPFQAALDKRVVITNGQRDRLIDVYGEESERVCVIENGIPVEELQADAYDLTTRDAIVFIGRFVEQKQPLLFVEIAQRLLLFDESLQFLMVGDGPLFKCVESRIVELGIADKVQLLGRQDGVAEILGAKAQLMIAPSLVEGLPMIGLEAMSLGVPILAADVPGWNDLIESGQDGWLIAGTDLDAYVEKALELRRHPSRLLAIGKRAQEKVHALYTSERMAARYQEIYRSAVLQHDSSKWSEEEVR